MKIHKIIAIFIAVFAITAFAKQNAKQKPANEEETNSFIENWVSGEISIFGLGVRYERMLEPSFSVGAEAYFNSLFFLWNDWGFIGFVRYYPAKPLFFLELGAGYNYHTGFGKYKYKDTDGTEETLSDWIETSGFVISPGMGFKIDMRKPGGFFVQPGVKLPITLGTQEPVIAGWNNRNSKFGSSIGFIIYCGLGYGF